MLICQTVPVVQCAYKLAVFIRKLMPPLIIKLRNGALLVFQRSFASARFTRISLSNKETINYIDETRYKETRSLYINYKN